MGLSDGNFFVIKHTLLPNGNHPISSPIRPMGVADTLEPYHVRYLFSLYHPPLFENRHTPLISLTGHFALHHLDTYQFLDKTFSGQVYQKYQV